MEIQQQSQGAVTVLKPMGPLSQADADQFKATATAIATKSLGRILIDASAIAFLDSHGIEVLADVTEEMSNSGRALKLCGANPTIQQVLEVTGWSYAFEFYEDVNTGVRSFL